MTERGVNFICRKGVKCLDNQHANLLLLLAELADEKGQVQINERGLEELMTARFNDPEEYQL